MPYKKTREQTLPKYEYKECEATLKNCTGRATQRHHIEPRTEENLNDIKNILLVCANCHDVIHKMPIEQATELGLIKSKHRL